MEVERLETEAEPAGQSTKLEQKTRVKGGQGGARGQDRADRAGAHQGGANGTRVHNRAQLKELRFSHVVLISAPFSSYVRLALLKAPKDSNN